jgi:hypothetical protein
MTLEAPLVMARSSHCKNVHARLAYGLSWLLQIRCISPSTSIGSLSRKTRRQVIPARVTCPDNNQGM